MCEGVNAALFGEIWLWKWGIRMVKESVAMTSKKAPSLTMEQATEIVERLYGSSAADRAKFIEDNKAESRRLGKLLRDRTASAKRR